MGSNTEQTFLTTVRREGILPEGSSVVAAVSGGGDSVGLLRLLHQFRSHMNWELSVLHIDHRLRPDSGDDACFVCDLAEELELHYSCVTPEPPERGSTEGEWSRIRHSVYCSLSREKEYLLAVGHTASDRAETLLMRLIEGSGLRGLGGMDYFGRGPVRRPLLDLTGREVRDYLGNLGQRWLEDSTNMDTSILRNRIRLEVMPHIEGIRPGAELGLARAAAGLADWRKAAFGSVDEIIAGLEDTSHRISRLVFSGIPAAFRLAVLWELSGRPRTGRLELEKTDIWLSGGGCGEKNLPGGYVLTAHPESIVITVDPGSDNVRK